MERPHSDPRQPLLHQYQQTSNPSSLATTVAAGIALLYFLQQVFVYFDYPVLSPQELAWNAVVYILPKQILLDQARRQELEANGMLSQTHAAKGDALRRMLGIGGNAILQKLPAEGFMRRASSLGAQLRPKSVQSDAPAGLGNWDNSCYQNSVLQGLASLGNLKDFLKQAGSKEDTTTESLLETVTKLNDAGNNGRQLWTPAKLKSMSSWQQQDAQEYYSKVLDELDKEAAKLAAAGSVKSGLETIVENGADESAVGTSGDAANDQDIRTTDLRNPLDGLLAQCVACTRCGYSEGLSMIPFNCLTIPLGSEHAYSLSDCLDEYTKIDEIPDVECAKCTLLRAEQQLENMLPPPPTIRSADDEVPIDSKTLSLPPELRAQAFQRLSAIKTALGKDDFADKTLNETCSISRKARVSSTKTRQAVIGRAPKSLVVHVNRSIFDEMTASQRKNYAAVRFPARLDLSPWIVKTERQGDGKISEGSGRSMLESSSAPSMEEHLRRDEVAYRIKAVVTHYGRHENGHYICYRQHPVRPTTVEEAVDVSETEPEDDDPRAAESEHEQNSEERLRWWRLSDEDVSAVSEEEVLAQNGVFMLFYERAENLPLTRTDLAVATPIPTMAEAGVDHDSRTGSEDRVAESSDETSMPADTAATAKPHTPDKTAPPSSISVTSEDSDSTDRGTATPDSPITRASTAPTTEDEYDPESETDQCQPPQLKAHPSTSPPSSPPPQAPSTPPFMRTAALKPKKGPGRGRGLGSGGFRAVAAS